jgi:hypothetical protein
MVRRMDLKTIAYWASVLALVGTISWLLIDTYDEIVHRDDLRRAMWRGVSALLAMASLALMLWHPPE